MMPIRNRRRRGFLSTPSARRATTERPAIGRHGKNFYPRPPRGGRRVPTGAGSARRNFYPRPPRGGRLQRVINCIQLFQFLSTPSARRATCRLVRLFRAISISIHALREEGDGLVLHGADVAQLISIHALREEGDEYGMDGADRQRNISIHALREEGDTQLQAGSSRTSNFYPRPPRGGRPSR